jgi:hypothetical protein
MPNLPFSLDRGERLLWSGCPRQGVVLRGTDWFLAPFSFLWVGFALSWNVTLWTHHHSPVVLRLAGLLVLVIGLYMMVGRFVFDARRRMLTSYAVTNQRILISTGASGESLRALDVRTLDDMTLRRQADGTGTITFARTPLPPAMAALPLPSAALPASFQEVADVERVHDIIREAQAATQSGASAA